MNISITSETQKKIEQLIASGRFSTPEEVVQEALELMYVDDDATADIERGLSDVAAGRIYSRDQVEEHLDTKFPTT